MACVQACPEVSRSPAFGCDRMPASRFSDKRPNLHSLVEKAFSEGLRLGEHARPVALCTGSQTALTAVFRRITRGWMLLALKR